MKREAKVNGDVVDPLAVVLIVVAVASGGAPAAPNHAKSGRVRVLGGTVLVAVLPSVLRCMFIHVRMSPPACCCVLLAGCGVDRVDPRKVANGKEVNGVMGGNCAGVG